MRLLSQSESIQFDRTIQSALPATDELLMESAAAQCADFISRRLAFSEVWFLCGPGHNGGDGLAVARHLAGRGCLCRVFCGEEEKSFLVRTQRERLQNIGLSVEPLGQFLKEAPVSSSVILVDALFGVGLDRPPEGVYEKVIQRLNALSHPVVSLDVPSGLDVSKGVSLGPCVRAQITLTIGALKPGFLTGDGPLVVGRIKRVRGGFPEKFFPDSTEKYWAILPSEIKSWIPQRSKRSHKGSVGKFHLVAGSKKYLGATKLAALGALSSGASFVQVYGEKGLRELLKELPEVIHQDSYASLFENLKPEDVVVLGPGWSSLSLQHEECLRRLFSREHQKVLVDAGALELVKQMKLRAPDSWVFTPHPGEMARWIGVSVQDVESDRFAAVRQAQSSYGGQILLKGYKPILRTGSDWWCLPYGDDRLAKAGTGDVLSGLIGGLMTQSSEVSRAVAVGVWAHSKSSVILSQSRNRHSLLTSELPPIIGRVLC